MLRNAKLIRSALIPVLVLIWTYSGASLPGFFSLKIDSANAAITFTNEGASANPDINDSTNDGTVYTNSSWTPPSSGLIIVSIFGGGTSGNNDVDNISGNGLTWVEIASVAYGGATPRALTLYAANATGSSAGATTITFKGTQVMTAIGFMSASGVDLSGGVAAAFIQTPTNTGTGTGGTVTLATAADSNNRPISMWSRNLNEAASEQTNWTAADDLFGTGPVHGMETQYRDDAFDTAAAANWTNSSPWGGIAAELKAEAVGGITISGTCKQTNQSTDCSNTAGNAIRVAVNGTLQAQTDATVDGSWSISSVTEPTPGQIVTIFIEGESASSSQAVAVTQWDSGNITDVELIEAHLSIGSSQRNTITNAELGNYDGSVSSRSFHCVRSGVLTVDAYSKVSSEELYIKGGNTYQPDSSGGDTINTHDVEINGIFDLDTNVVSASGSWDNNGRFIANTGSVSFVGIGSETISNLPASAGFSNGFYHLEIDSPNNGGTLTLNDYHMVASGQINVESGDTLSVSSGMKLTHTGSTLRLNGTISGAGRYVYRSTTAFPTSGTISSILVFDAQSGDQTMSNRSYAGDIEITNNSTTTARSVTIASGNPLLSSNLYIVASGSQDITLTGATNDPAINIGGNLDFTGSGAGTEAIITGAGLWSSSGTVVDFTGGTFTTEMGNALYLDGGGTLTTGGQTLRNVIIDGSLTLANETHTINGYLDMSNVVLTAGTSVVKISSISAYITGLTGGSLYDLIIDPSSAGTITLQTSNLTVSNTLTIASDDRFKIESGRTLTLSGTGTPLAINGTFEPDDGSTVAYTGTTANVASASFGNLTLGGTGTYTLPSDGNPTIKGDLSVTNNATITSGSYALLFRGGTTRTITDNNTTKQNLGEIVVRSSTSGNTTLTLGSDIKIASISVESSQTLDSNGTKTLTINGSSDVFKISGTFTPSTGTVQYTGGTTNVGAPSSVYNNLILGGTGTYTLPASNLTLRGDMTVTTGATVTKSASNKIIFAKGGTQTLTGNATNSDLGIIQVTANVSNTALLLGSAIKVSSASIDASQILNANGANTIDITGTGSSFTNNGIFQPRTGTVQYTGTSATIGASKYNHLTLGGSGTYTLPSSGTTNILGNLTLTSGSTITSGSATLFFKKGGSQSITDNNSTKQNLGEISVQASTGGNSTLTLGSSVRIASASVDSSQTLDANGINTLTITGVTSPLVVNGTFTRSTGAVVFTGASATNIPALNYYDLKVQPSANSITHTFLSGTASVSKTFTVGNGTNTSTTVTADTNNTGLDVASVSISANSTLVADGSAELTISRHWINNGSFTHTSGTVTLTSQETSSITGATTFNHLTSTNAGKKLKFGAGQTFTFAGTFTITGVTGNTIKIESTASASQWLANFNSAQSAVTYVTLTDSGCDGSSADVTLDGTATSGGNNDGSCWIFPGGVEPGISRQGGGNGGTDSSGSGGNGAITGGGDEGAGGGGIDPGSGGGGSPPVVGGGDEGAGGGGSPVLYSLWNFLLKIVQ